MAYSKHIIAISTLSLMVSGGLYLSANYVQKGAPDSTEYREAPQTTNTTKKRKKAPKGALKKSAQGDIAFYANQLTSLPIKLRPGTDHREDSRENPVTTARCRSTVYKTLTALPAAHRSQLSELTLFYTKDGRRGLGGNKSVVLRCLNVTDSELAAVLVHEIGHLTDSGYLTGTDSAHSGFYDFDEPVKADDPSAEFFRLSWNSEKSRKAQSGVLDFVSLYAMTDPFEDFAETYTYYRLHGPKFRRLAETNEILAQKYLVMKNFAFSGQEFDLDVTAPNLNIFDRQYDVTVQPYSVKDFLGS